MSLSSWIRARPLASAAASVLALALLAQAALAIRLASARNAAESARGRVREMRSLAEEHARIRGRMEETRSETPPGKSPLTPAAVDRLALQEGVARNISDTSVSRTRVDEQTEEQVISFSIKAVSREGLARFLLAGEGLGPGVRVKKLRLSANAENDRLVDAQVQFAAHENVETRNE
jgi:hypothetical protein